MQLQKDSFNKILILGIGNYLMADEGVGVHMARMFEAEQLPAGVDVLDGGTGGFHLLEYFEQYQHVILVDATLDGLEPGTIRLIKPKFYSDFPAAMSTHDIGLKDLVGALQLLNSTTEIHLFVVSIKSIQEQGIELTAPIKEILPEIKKRVMGLVEQLLINEPALPV